MKLSQVIVSVLVLCASDASFVLAAGSLNRGVAGQPASSGKSTTVKKPHAFASATLPRPDTSKLPPLRYRFVQFDSVVYRLRTTDTIQFVDAPWLIKEQDQIFSIVCDFVDSKGQMYLRQDLREIHSRERQENDSTVVELHSSAWKDRTAYIIIDSTGRRVVSQLLDTVHAMIAPGGAYQLPILLSLLDTAAQVGTMRRGWNVTHLDTLVENGFPYPHIRQLFTCKQRDTVLNNERCYAVSFGQTAQASQQTMSRNLGVYSRSVINSWGTMIFSARDGIPTSMNAHSDLKLWVSTKEGTQKGQERVHTRYECIYRSPRR